MKWMRERDLLIAQTMAFVQSVTGKKPDMDQPAASFTPPASEPLAIAPTFEAPVPVASPMMPDIEAMLAETIAAPAQPPKPLHVARVPQRSEYQNDIQNRVANFRANQQRFLREREEYCASTMAKMQKALDALPPPRPDR